MKKAAGAGGKSLVDRYLAIITFFYCSKFNIANFLVQIKLSAQIRLFLWQKMDSLWVKMS